MAIKPANWNEQHIEHVYAYVRYLRQATECSMSSYAKKHAEVNQGAIHENI